MAGARARRGEVFTSGALFVFVLLGERGAHRVGHSCFQHEARHTMNRCVGHRHEGATRACAMPSMESAMCSAEHTSLSLKACSGPSGSKCPAPRHRSRHVADQPRGWLWPCPCGAHLPAYGGAKLALRKPTSASGHRFLVVATDLVCVSVSWGGLGGILVTAGQRGWDPMAGTGMARQQELRAVSNFGTTPRNTPRGIQEAPKRRMPR